jgi:hypothetical protein
MNAHLRSRVTLRRLMADVLLPLLLLCAVPQFCMGAGTTITRTQADEIFARANAFYQSQQYQKARDAYASLVYSGINSPDAYYNLGTAEARLGHSGPAIAYLLKAQKLAPRDDDIRANLSRVRPSSTPDDHSGLHQSLFERIVGYFTTDEWLWLGWGILTGCAVLFLCRRFVRNEGLRWSFGTLGAICCLAFLLVLGPACTSAYRQWFENRAVLVKDSISRSGPDERFTEVATLVAGVTVNELSYQESGFQQVETPDGVRGYIEKSALVPL